MPSAAERLSEIAASRTYGQSMETQQIDPSLSLDVDALIDRYPDDFYLDYAPYYRTSAGVFSDDALGLHPALVWNHPIFGRLWPDIYDPGAQSTLALSHMLDHLLRDLRRHEAYGPPRLSLFIVLSPAQFCAPSLSQALMLIQLVIDYHNWSLSLALSSDCRHKGKSRLIPLCGPGPRCMGDTVRSKPLKLPS